MTPPPSEDVQRARTRLAFLLALAPFAYLVWRFDFLADDAFISFRYAKNLAHGAGLCFNLAPGEPPVEGYSNFLWVLLMALGERFGLAAPILSRLVSVASGVTLLWLFARALSRRVATSTLVTTCGVLFLATLPPMAVWSTSGLATMPLALCVFGVFDRLCVAERPRGLQAGVLAALAVLLRADGAVFTALVLAGAGLDGLLRRDPARLRAVFLTAALAALAFGGQVAFRLAYYGDWLPNTYRAKAQIDELTPQQAAQFRQRGLNYVVSFFLTFVSPALALLLGLIGARRARDGIRTVAWIAVLGNLLYAYRAGGDFMAMGRFFVPTLPFLALLCASGLERLGRRPAPAANGGGAGSRGRLAVGSATALLCALSLLPAFDLHVVPKRVRYRFQFRWNTHSYEAFRSEWYIWDVMRRNALNWTLLGKALKLHTRPGERMLCGPIGAIGYYSDMYLYDSYGLTNRELAQVPIRGDLKSPGHDRQLTPESFAGKRLDYMGAAIVDADDRWAGLPDLVRQDRHPEFTTEFVPLDPAQGFEPGTELMLRRIRPEIRRALLGEG